MSWISVQAVFCCNGVDQPVKLVWKSQLEDIHSGSCSLDKGWEGNNGIAPSVAQWICRDRQDASLQYSTVRSPKCTRPWETALGTVYSSKGGNGLTAKNAEQTLGINAGHRTKWMNERPENVGHGLRLDERHDLRWCSPHNETQARKGTQGMMTAMGCGC